MRNKQDVLIESFVPQAVTHDPAEEQRAQRNHDRSAVSVLQQDSNPVAVLNLYAKKTKVVAEETSRKIGTNLVYT